jgi:NitT/TauT family transport system substrate-binding protein
MSFDARARARALLALVVCTALFVTACGNDDSGDEGGAASTDGGKEVVDQPFLLSSSFGIYFLPIQIAYDQGYFEDEGLNLKVQETDGSSFVTQQIIAGNAEFGVAGAPTDIIAYDKDPNVRALSCIESQSIFSIYVPADSDIQDVTQLDGKKLGINERGGGEEPMVTAVIAENDLDTEVVPVGQETATIVRALQDGQVAAFSSSIGTRTSIEAELELRDITPDKYVATPGDCLITTADVLNEKPEVAAGIARAILKGMYFAFANEEAALDIGCKIAPEQCEGQQGYAEALLAKMMTLMQPSDPSGVPSKIEPPGWELSRDLLVQTGTLKNEVDVTDLISSAEVAKVEEDAFGDVETLKAEAEEDAASYKAG